MHTFEHAGTIAHLEEIIRFGSTIEAVRVERILTYRENTILMFITANGFLWQKVGQQFLHSISRILISAVPLPGGCPATKKP